MYPRLHGSTSQFLWRRVPCRKGVCSYSSLRVLPLRNPGSDARHEVFVSDVIFVAEVKATVALPLPILKSPELAPTAFPAYTMCKFIPNNYIQVETMVHFSAILLGNNWSLPRHAWPNPARSIRLASACLHAAGRADLAVRSRCCLGRLVSRRGSLVQPADVAGPIEHARVLDRGGVSEVAVHARNSAPAAHLDIVERRLPSVLCFAIAARSV
jgi:hypothetical protein